MTTLLHSNKRPLPLASKLSSLATPNPIYCDFMNVFLHAPYFIDYTFSIVCLLEMD